MKILRVIREYEVQIPDVDTDAWNDLGHRVFRDLGEDVREAERIMKSDEEIAIWLSYQNDLGNFEGINPHAEDYGAVALDETVYDHKHYEWRLISRETDV